jgi:hypothetical protein
MDGRAKVVSERAKAVVRELGLQALDVEDGAEITGAQYRAWAELPATKRLVGWIAEGLVVTLEQAEVNSTKRRHMQGMRADTRNDLAKQEVVARNQAEQYKRLLHAIAEMANRQD